MPGRRTGCCCAGKAAGAVLARIRELADRAAARRKAAGCEAVEGCGAGGLPVRLRRSERRGGLRSEMSGDFGQAAAVQARRRAGAWRGSESWRPGPRHVEGPQAAKLWADAALGSVEAARGPRWRRRDGAAKSRRLQGRWAGAWRGLGSWRPGPRRSERPQAARALGECGAGGHLVAAAALGALRRLARRGCRTGCGFAGKAAGGGLARIRELAGRARGTSKGLRLQGRRANAAQAVCQ